MPIDWDTVPDAATRSARSSSSSCASSSRCPAASPATGVRETLAVLARDLPLEVVETPSGDAGLRLGRPARVERSAAPGSTGRTERASSTSPTRRCTSSATARRSTPSLSLEELRAHVFTHRDDPDLVPYRTSYWEEQWGFCMSRRQLESLPDGRLPRRRRRDARRRLAHLRRGDASPGDATTEFLLSTYVCHPALANDNLSGVVLLWALGADAVAAAARPHVSRLLWSPGTLGPLCWLARNRDHARPRPSTVSSISCVGDPGPLRYKRSRRGDAPVDRAAAYVLGARPGSIVTRLAARAAATSASTARPDSTFPSARSRARRTASSPSTTRRPTTSILVTATALATSFRAALRDHRRRRDERLVPQPARRTASRRLGKRGLYQSVPDGTNPEAPLLWVLSLSDGRARPARDRRAVGSSVSRPIREAAATLEEHELLERVP